MTTTLAPAPTITTLAPPVIRTNDDGDHEKLAHIVMPANLVLEAMFAGTFVTALCGKTWVPTRDPERYPPCKTCIETYERDRGKPFPGRRA